MMGDIFTGASRVIAWLQNSCSAIVAQDSNQKGAQAFAKAINHGIPELDNVETSFLVAALLRFMTHKYWSRAWIVQELILNEDVELHWERQKCNWKNIRDFLVRRLYSSTESDLQLQIKEWYQIDPSQLAIFGLATFRVEAATPSIQTSLLALAARFQRQKCSQPYDRLFAYIGIEAALKQTTFHPDYSELPEHLLFRLARHHTTPVTIEDIQMFERAIQSIRFALPMCPYRLKEDDWSSATIPGKSMRVPQFPAHLLRCTVCGNLGRNPQGELLVGIPQSPWHFIFTYQMVLRIDKKITSFLLTHVVNLSYSRQPWSFRCRSFRVLGDSGPFRHGSNNFLDDLHNYNRAFIDSSSGDLVLVHLNESEGLLPYLNVARVLHMVDDTEVICMDPPG